MAKEELRIEYVPIDKLVKWPRNPKRHAPEKIEKSFSRFGFINPIIIDENSGRIVAGHGRIDTAERMKLLGLDPPDRVVVKNKAWWLPVVRGVKFKSEADAEAYLVADNQISISEGFDDEPLREIIQSLNTDLVDVLGMGNEVIERLRGPVKENGEAQAAPSGAEEQPEEQQQQEPEKDLFSVYPMTEVIETAAKWYRENGFPYPNLTLHEQMQEINHLAAIEDEGAINSVTAFRVADSYHHHRFNLRVRGMKTPLENFNQDRSLKRSIEQEIKYSYVRTGYLNLIDLVFTAQSCGNFRPGVAMYFYRTYGKKNGLVLDPCAGFGGRIVGWIASSIGGTYVGVDPATETQQNNQRLVKALGVDKNVRLLHQCFEDVDLKKEKLEGKCDLVFTSPPYYNKEEYTAEDTQSFIRYPDFKGWTDNFLRPFLVQCYKALKKGGHCCLNIADITERKSGKRVYPLELLTTQYAEDAGFKLIETKNITFGQNKWGRGEHLQSMLDVDSVKQVEPVFVFQK